MAHLEGSFVQVEKRLDSIDRRLDSIDRRFEQVDARFAKIDLRFAQVDVRFNWVLGTLAASWFTVIATQIATTLTIIYHR